MKYTSYIITFTEEVPARMDNGVIYNELNAIAWLLCPCGCGDTIALNLLVGAKPLWKINGNSITPSVQRTIGCRSHFTITNGIVTDHNKQPQ